MKEESLASEGEAWGLLLLRAEPLSFRAILRIYWHPKKDDYQESHSDIRLFGVPADKMSDR